MLFFGMNLPEFFNKAFDVPHGKLYWAPLHRRSVLPVKSVEGKLYGSVGKFAATTAKIVANNKSLDIICKLRNIFLF
jgi:hypothetical protein